MNTMKEVLERNKTVKICELEFLDARGKITGKRSSYVKVRIGFLDSVWLTVSRYDFDKHGNRKMHIGDVRERVQ